MTAPPEQPHTSAGNGGEDATRRMPRHLDWAVAAALLLFVLAVCAVLKLIWSYPDDASYALSVTTERIELVVPQSANGSTWTGLRLVKVDGQDRGCQLEEFVLGTQPLKIRIDSLSSRKTSDGDESSAGDFEMTVFPGSTSLSIACTDGTSVNVALSAVLKPPTAHTGMTLSFFGDIVAGANPDTRGSYSKILLSGSVRATAKLKGSHQPGAVSEYHLHPGDTVRLTGRHSETAAAAGLMWPKADGLQLIAHAVDADVSIDRLGIGRIDEVDLMPGVSAILQADPSLVLLSAIFTALLTFLPTFETYALRLWRWLKSRLRSS